MRYVERDENGKITGTFYNNQNGKYTERLYDDDPELLAFNNMLIAEQSTKSNIQHMDNPQIFSYPGYTIFKIPDSIDLIKVKLWGAGGGSSASNSLEQSNNGYSGSYVICNIDISTIENKNLIIHIGGKGKKSLANSFGYSDGAGGGGYSSISTFDGKLLASAKGGDGGNGVGYDSNDTTNAKPGNADNGGINGGGHGGLGEMGGGGKGGIGGGMTIVDETITSLVDIKNGINELALNTDDPYYIKGTTINSGGLTQTLKNINGTDGGDGLVIIEWQ